MPIKNPPEAVRGQNESAWPVRALTRKREADGAGYIRETAVESQVRELSLSPERDRRGRLLGASKDELAWGDERRLREETLIYFLREYARRGDEEAAWRIAETLVERTQSHVQRKIARWRLSPEETDDCARDLYAELWPALFDFEAKSEFWEVRFWVCLDRRLLNLIQKRQSVADNEHGPGDELGAGNDDDGGDRVFARIADTAARPDRLAEHADALAVLTEAERTAVYLVYVEGLPEESDDPERLSAARVLGVTGRSVRNYLRRAKEKLKRYAAAE